MNKGILAVVAWIVLGANAAGAQDDGAAIAARWCANCHATGVDQQPRAQDAAPTFDDIASRLSAGQIEAILTAPHEPMRGIDLSRRDIETMAAFIADRAP